MVRVGPAHARFHAVFLLNNHWLWFSFFGVVDFYFYTLPKQPVHSYLSTTAFFTHVLTEDILFPKRKASGALLLEILGERQRNKLNCKGYRDWFDDTKYLVPALVLTFQRPIWKVLMESGPSKRSNCHYDGIDWTEFKISTSHKFQGNHFAWIHYWQIPDCCELESFIHRVCRRLPAIQQLALIQKGPPSWTHNLCDQTGPPMQKDPELDFMVFCHCLETLNFMFECDFVKEHPRG